ncbi:hypothetical protein [Vibrio algarum]|uniref:Uncharacterized protein n=1 Tax=Vibrio algarum TaxID=3020714 RepID=A0ABT4YQH0_9VIBR|nr:hypothetical protein [Vibrio sp. KJ40-1]MDB1123802.1 hypothetical protein [Vibrio sp. KJ40-1]
MSEEFDDFYTCEVREDYKQTSSIVSYGIENIAFKDNVADWDECLTVTLDGYPAQQTLQARFRTEGVLTDKVRLHYLAPDISDSAYSTYFNLSANPDNLSIDTLNELSFIDADLTNEEDYNAHKLSKVSYDYSQPDNEVVRDQYTKWGTTEEWKRTIEYMDGSSEDFCGPSEEQIELYNLDDYDGVCPIY